MAPPAAPDDFQSVLEALRVSQRPQRRPFPLARDVRRRVRGLSSARPSTGDGAHAWVPEEVSALTEEEWRAIVQWYVVVDDHDEGTAVLSITPWPFLDDRHRLVFSREQTTEREVAKSALESFLAANRCQVTPDGLMASAIAGDAKELRVRPVRVGDVFGLSDAALTALGGSDTGTVPPVVVDVSASGREAAKIAFYAAAARPLDPTRRSDRELAEITWAEQDSAGGGT